LPSGGELSLGGEEENWLRLLADNRPEEVAMVVVQERKRPHQEKVLELYRSLGCLEQSELSELSESLGSRNCYSNV